MSEKVDITIVGAGVIGCAVADEIARIDFFTCNSGPYCKNDSLKK